MKFKQLAALAAATVLALGASVSMADTSTGNFDVSGTFTASCSFTAPSFALGSVDLSTYIYNPGGPFEHLRIPVVVNVTCNASTVPWTIFNSSGQSMTDVLTIGSDTSNTMCLANDASTTSIAVCPDATATGTNIIGGAGTKARNALLLVHSNSPTVKAFRGNGALSGTLPLTLAF
ncbi:hypothetical protein [Scleromatobacter humisilvae]|uniref:Spore coat protein U domain-containing protein n=1 Tax=Scleromatobacter humisilvae TaxID=2897159 RepID=A0A9X1YMW0_9BURK|nr:hypothetical protein [Scleromatobacter humisilvae]MCK9687307.1 hypothetical protein [Scleromatobacter humisilvae]